MTESIALIDAPRHPLHRVHNQADVGVEVHRTEQQPDRARDDPQPLDGLEQPGDSALVRATNRERKQHCPKSNHGKQHANEAGLHHRPVGEGAGDRLLSRGGKQRVHNAGERDAKQGKAQSGNEDRGRSQCLHCAVEARFRAGSIVLTLVPQEESSSPQQHTET